MITSSSLEDHNKNIESYCPGINLEQLAVVDFDGRIDTKFIFPKEKLNDFLELIKEDVVILEVKGKRIFDYKNIYFDKPDFDFFKRHHSGFANRVKIRARQYSETGPFMLEVKTKTNKDLTLKKRSKLANLNSIITEETEAFLQTQIGYGFKEMPNLTGVNYQRMTFANKALTEKFTLDINLTAVENNNERVFSNLVIAEVKQERFSYNSVFVQSLKKLKIYPSSFSKYCTSVMQFHPELKNNRFKKTARKLEKIQQ